MKLRIASPCGAAWNEMPGDDRVRYCGRCSKHVYDLSAMTAAEAYATIAEHEELPCTRMYQRRDGTVMFRDCSIDATGRIAFAVAGVAAVVASVALATGEQAIAEPDDGGYAMGGLSIDSHQLQHVPVFVIASSGDITYRGTAIAASAIPTLLAEMSEKDPTSERLAVVQADPETIAFVINTVTSAAEASDYKVLYAMKSKPTTRP